MTRVRNVLWNDHRVRAAWIGYLLPLFLILLVGRGSPFMTAIAVFSAALIVFPLNDLKWFLYTGQGFLLGVVSAITLNVMWTGEPARFLLLSRYVFLQSIFHFSEMFATGITNNENLKPDSFLLNHSSAYWIAALSAWLEFGIEAVALPWLNRLNWISWAGMFVCLTGEIIRKTAMFHASNAFTHLIAVRKHTNHSLVTDGIYAYMRHPGYVGWFLWSVGTQIVLCNPFCFFAYAFVTFRFFEDRIYDEERYLIDFFGRRYVDYQQEVPCGIPFIRGYTPPSSRSHNQ